MNALRAASGSSKAAMRWLSDGVSTVPGHTVLQRMPWPTKSMATDLVNPITAALVAP